MEDKPSEKLKSTLSADVPPFIPRSHNLELLSSVVPTQNGINHVPQYLHDTAHVGENEWQVPVMSPASSGVMLFPVAPVVQRDYQFPSPQDNGYHVETSTFPSNKYFSSKAKKSQTPKNLEEKTVSASEANDSFSQSAHVSSENRRKHKETSRYQNPNLKINFVRNSDKQKSQIRIMAPCKSLNSSVKLESSAEFPSLPAPSDKNKLYSQAYNNELYQPIQNSTYSAILRSVPKHSSNPDQKLDISVSNKSMLIANSSERTRQQNTNRKQKSEKIPEKRHIFQKGEKSSDGTRGNEQKDAKKKSRFQTERKQSARHSSANAPESVVGREKQENNKRNNHIAGVSLKEGSSIMDQMYSRQSNSKDPECLVEQKIYHENNRKNDGTTVNSSRMNSRPTDKMHSRQYSSNGTESAIKNKKHIENNKIIMDSLKEETSLTDPLYQKQYSLKALESMKEWKKYAENNRRKNNQIIVSCSDEESCTAGPLMKVSNSQKRKKRNKKKKKVNVGKVSLLSPEVFANITNKLSKESKINQNDSFNLCDQLDFPSLSSLPPVTAAEVKSETENHNSDNPKKGECSSNGTSSNEKPLKISVSNVWRPAPYSDIAQANKAKDSEIQKNINSTKKTPGNSYNEGMPVMASKKKERKKKKKKSEASSEKTQEDSEIQNKCNSLIQISLTSMVTSLQQVKLNQMKKKETKARVISTKRGIMDKMANPHNILDSSAPMRKRGKERERPGKKRLSAMRKIILKERERRRTQYLETQKCKSEDEGEDKKLDMNVNVMASSSNSVDNSELSSEENCEQEDIRLQASKIILHTRKFRDYCDHMISEEIDSTVLAILKDLIRFQDRLHEKDPIKARMKRRLVYGLREVTKHLRLCKLKCIIIAPNIENIPSEGGLTDALQVIINLAQQQNVPYLFALERRSLGKVCMKIVPVSCVGIFNYDGAEGHYRKLLEFLSEAREKYNEVLKLISTFVTKDVEAQLLQPNILPAAVQPIRSEVLSKIAMHNTLTRQATSEDSKVENGTQEGVIDWNTSELLQRMENFSIVTDHLVGDDESLAESEEYPSEETTIEI